MSSNLFKINTTTQGKKTPKVSKMSSKKQKKVVFDLDEVWTTEDVKRLNALAGWHFYSPSTSRCFKSHPVGDVYRETIVVRKKLKTIRVHFVDSSMSPMGRTYTPCYLTEDGEIERHRGRWLGTWRDSEVPADIVRFPTAEQAKRWIKRWINTREYEFAKYPDDSPPVAITTVRLRTTSEFTSTEQATIRKVANIDYVLKDLKDVIREHAPNPKLPVTNKNYFCGHFKSRGGKDLVIVVEVATGKHVIRLQAV